LLQSIYLKDNLLNKYIDLRKAKSYSTNINTGINNSRFSIVFKKETTTTISDLENQIDIFANGNDIIINANNNKIFGISIYDINGKLIKQESINDSNIINMNSKTGIYFVKVISEDNIYTKKLFIK
ncbi:MAG: T9SS type A sorting domain-containing protein, partial [Chlorobi bacterium]|nr:T9SS type A sorting domain-containing protein [Chlorobiota bacterium]